MRTVIAIYTLGAPFAGQATTLGVGLGDTASRATEVTQSAVPVLGPVCRNAGTCYRPFSPLTTTKRASKGPCRTAFLRRILRGCGGQAGKGAAGSDRRRQGEAQTTESTGHGFICHGPSFSATLDLALPTGAGESVVSLSSLGRALSRPACPLRGETFGTTATRHGLVRVG